MRVRGALVPLWDVSGRLKRPETPSLLRLGFQDLQVIHALELSLTDVIEFSAAGPKRVDLGANAADGSRAALL
jgi:hypothetical protein